MRERCAGSWLVHGALHALAPRWRSRQRSVQQAKEANESAHMLNRELRAGSTNQGALQRALQPALATGRPDGPDHSEEATMSTTDIDMSVFAPTSSVPRDPFNGFSPEEYEARQAEKNARTQRVRIINRKAKEGTTPNRELWCCVRCVNNILPGQPFYLGYDSNTMMATMGCQDCYGPLADQKGRPAIRQVVLVQECNP